MVTVINKAYIDITSDFVYSLNRNKCLLLFEAILALWPSELDVSVQQKTSPTGCYIPNLSAAWDEVELRVEELERSADIFWCEDSGVVEYAIFTELHRMSRGNTLLKPNELSFEKVERRLLTNYLGWEGQEPSGARSNSILRVDEDTGEILKVYRPVGLIRIRLFLQDCLNIFKSRFRLWP